MKQKRIGSSIIVVLVMIYLLIPLAVTIIYSLFEQWTDIVPRGFSFSAYAEIFQDKEFLLSLGRTVVICIIPVALTIVLVLLALFQAELRTLNTIERVDDTDLFTMTYLGDYGLDDFLAQAAPPTTTSCWNS